MVRLRLRRRQIWYACWQKIDEVRDMSFFLVRLVRILSISATASTIEYRDDVNETIVQYGNRCISDDE